MSGPALVVLDGLGLHVDGRLVCPWPGGRYDGSAPSGLTDMVLGYRDREATHYTGCNADVPIISTWYREHERYPKLLLEVTSRTGSVVRLRSKRREYFLDVRTLPGCPRIPDPVDDVPCDRLGAWEWQLSQQDLDLQEAINLAQLGSDWSFVEFLRAGRECVTSSAVPRCLGPLVADRVHGNAAGLPNINTVTGERFVEYLWNGEYQGHRIRDIVTGCFTKGSLQPMGAAANIYFSDFVCEVSDGRVLTGLRDLDHVPEGAVTLDAWAPVQPVAAGPPVTIGVLLGASTQPVARFNGRGWVNTWPDPVDTVEPTLTLDRVPREWLDGPVPPRWVGHLVNGTAVPFTATEVGGGGSGDSGCTGPMGIRFKEQLPRVPGLFDSLHVGIATDRAWRTEAVTPVARSHAAFRRAETIARELFAAADRGMITFHSYDDDSAGLLRTRRFRETPVVVDALFASGRGERPTYYFEASRWLSDGLRVFITGWIAPNSGPLGAIVDSAGVSAGISPKPTNIEEWLYVAHLVPLGVVWMSDRPVWVMEIPLGEATAYGLYQVWRGTISPVMRTDGGGC